MWKIATRVDLLCENINRMLCFKARALTDLSVLWFSISGIDTWPLF